MVMNVVEIKPMAHCSNYRLLRDRQVVACSACWRSLRKKTPTRTPLRYKEELRHMPRNTCLECEPEVNDHENEQHQNSDGRLQLATHQFQVL